MLAAALLLLGLEAPQLELTAFEGLLGPPVTRSAIVARFPLAGRDGETPAGLYGASVTVWTSPSWTAVEARLLMPSDEIAGTTNRLVAAGFEVVAVATPQESGLRRLTVRGFGTATVLASQLSAVSRDWVPSPPTPAAEPPWLAELPGDRERWPNGVGVVRMPRPDLDLAPDDLPAHHELRWWAAPSGHVELALTVVLAPWEIGKASAALAAAGFAVTGTTLRPGLAEERPRIELDALARQAGARQIEGLRALLARLGHRPADRAGHSHHVH